MDYPLLVPPSPYFMDGFADSTGPALGSSPHSPTA
jgi:hypothetical protein